MTARTTALLLTLAIALGTVTVLVWPRRLAPVETRAPDPTSHEPLAATAAAPPTLPVLAPAVPSSVIVDHTKKIRERDDRRSATRRTHLPSVAPSTPGPIVDLSR